METIIKKISNIWHKKPAVDLNQISSIEKDVGLKFPEDYKSFLMWSNGGEGRFWGENYISLWEAEEILILNKKFQIQKYLSDKYLAIGTDGGGVCYGYYQDDSSIFKCGLGDLDIDEVITVAQTLTAFFEKALTEEI